MKVRILLDEQGSAVAIERMDQQAAAKAGEWSARVVEGKGQKFHELELPAEFAKIDSADDFYARLTPHLTKLKR